MKTILHIGSPKTGTTALQQGLYAARERLLSKGVLYPFLSSAEVSKNHGPLSMMLIKPEKLPRRFRFMEEAERESACSTALQELSYQIAKNEPDSLILSSEYFFRVIPQQAWFELLERIPGCDPANLRICCYIRRPSAHYLSILQQKFKASYEIRPIAPHNYRRVLETYQERFPDAEISVRVFEKGALKDNDILADFLHSQLPDLDGEDVIGAAHEEANISLSAASMVVLRDYREKFYPYDNDKYKRPSTILARILGELDHELELSRPKLKPEVIDLIDHCSEDPIWLRDTHSVEFADIDYDRVGKVALDKKAPPITSLREIIELDTKLLGKLLSRLRKRKFIRENDRHQLWVDDMKARKETI